MRKHHNFKQNHELYLGIQNALHYEILRN